MTRLHACRIIVACDTLAVAGKGGMERLAIELANLLCDEGATVFLLGTEGNSSLQYETRPDIFYLQAPYCENVLPVLPVFLKEKKFDVYIYFCVNHKLIFHTRLARSIANRLIVTESASPQRIAHTNWKSATEKAIFSGPAERHSVLMHADAIRVEVEESVKSFPPWLKPKVFNFVNGVDQSPEIKKAKSRTLLMVGGGKKYKRLDFLLTHLRSIIAAAGPLRVLVPGKYPGAELLALARDLGVEEFVEFLGPVTDMAPVYRSSDLHVICSEDESFGLCTAEAMCFGTPTVGCAAAIGTRNIITHERNGLLYSDNRHPDQFIDHVTRLITDSTLYSKLSTNCTRDSATFSLTKYHENWLDLIERVLAGENPSGRSINSEPQYFSELSSFSQGLLFSQPRHTKPVKAELAKRA